MATEELVPEWTSTPAVCHACLGSWHSEPAGDCETSCLAPIVIVPDPLRWDGDDT